MMKTKINHDADAVVLVKLNGTLRASHFAECADINLAKNF